MAIYLSKMAATMVGSKTHAARAMTGELTSRGA